MMKYTQTTTLSPADFDAAGNLPPQRVLALFQELATAHAEELGLGFEDMLRRNLLWMVSQIRFEVCSPILPHQSLTLESWPLPPNRLGYERCYRISDANGKELLRGTSNWVVIDTATRKLAAVDTLYPSDDYCTEQTFEGRARRIKEGEKCKFALKITPQKCHIDHNGHVNNTHYAAFGMEALGAQNTPIKAFQIDYLREVLEGEAIFLYTQKTEETSAVHGYNEAEERMFACQITY
jgi:acyl-ACP thioesterase